MNNLILLVARALISFTFLESGIGKISAYAGTQAYMESHGVPGVLLPLTILLEVGCGLMVLLGWHTRLAAWLLAAFTAAAALIFHTNFADHVQWVLFTFHLTMIGGFLALAVHGPGGWALETRGRG